MIKFCTIIFCLFFVFACNETTTQTNEKELVETVETNKITSKDIGNLKFKDYALSSDSERLIANWSKYQEFNNQIGFLKKADLSFFGGEKKVLIELIKDLKKETPKQVNTNAVQSRMVVLETTILKLHNDLNLNNSSKKTRLKSIKEVLISMSNLNNQVNSKLEFDRNNIDKPQ